MQTLTSHENPYTCLLKQLSARKLYASADLSGGALALYLAERRVVGGVEGQVFEVVQQLFKLQVRSGYRKKRLLEGFAGKKLNT
jgi:hypothetical protein